MRDDLVVPGEHEEDFVLARDATKSLPFPFRLWNYVCLKKNLI